MTKTSARELAVLEGTPAFDAPLHVGRPNVGDEERLFERLRDILDRRWLTNSGRYVEEFEERIAEHAGVRHAVAVTNGTVGLDILCRALGLTGEVIVPSFTFVATAHALRWQGITPRFCDVDPQTHNLDPASVKALITPATTGIVGVHVWGRPCEIEALGCIAERHGLALLFDAAHAFGVTHRGRPTSTFGYPEVFSFHATKFVNSFEGGAIVTDDDALADRLRRMRNFGFADYDTVVGLGTNGKMAEPSAAMGLTSLESMDRFVAANRANHGAYRAGLAGLGGVKLVDYPPGESHNYQYIVVEIDEDSCGLHRDALHAVLQAENVLARRYFHPGCHRMAPHAPSAPLPHTERLTEQVLCLPTGTAVRGPDIECICGIIRVALADPDLVAKAVGVGDRAQGPDGPPAVRDERLASP